MILKPNLQIDDADAARIANLLGCDPSQLGTRLAGHAQAAISEYVEMYLGRRAFSRGSDMLEHRLALLMQYAFANQVPSEDQVARLFQSTPSQGRSLIRASLSKYRYQLQAAAAASAKSVLEKARVNAADEFVMEIRTAFLVDLMNQALAEKDGRQKPVIRVKDNVSTFSTARASYEALCAVFGAKSVT
jgi:hypothetical protein